MLTYPVVLEIDLLAWLFIFIQTLCMRAMKAHFWSDSSSISKLCVWDQWRPTFGLTLHLYPNFVYESNEGSLLVWLFIYIQTLCMRAMKAHFWSDSSSISKLCVWEQWRLTFGLTLHLYPNFVYESNEGSLLVWLFIYIQTLCMRAMKAHFWSDSSSISKLWVWEQWRLTFGLTLHLYPNFVYESNEGSLLVWLFIYIQTLCMRAMKAHFWSDSSSISKLCVWEQWRLTLGLTLHLYPNFEYESNEGSLLVWLFIYIQTLCMRAMKAHFWSDSSSISKLWVWEQWRLTFGLTLHLYPNFVYESNEGSLLVWLFIYIQTLCMRAMKAHFWSDSSSISKLWVWEQWRLTFGLTLHLYPNFVYESNEGSLLVWLFIFIQTLCMRAMKAHFWSDSSSLSKLCVWEQWRLTFGLTLHLYPNFVYESNEGSLLVWLFIYIQTLSMRAMKAHFLSDSSSTSKLCVWEQWRLTFGLTLHTISKLCVWEQWRLTFGLTLHLYPNFEYESNEGSLLVWLFIFIQTLCMRAMKAHFWSDSSSISKLWVWEQWRLTFGLTLHLYPNFVYESNEGSLLVWLFIYIQTLCMRAMKAHFWSDSSSISKLCVWEQWRLGRVCGYAHMCWLIWALVSWQFDGYQNLMCWLMHWCSKRIFHWNYKYTQRQWKVTSRAIFCSIWTKNCGYFSTQFYSIESHASPLWETVSITSKCFILIHRRTTVVSIAFYRKMQLKVWSYFFVFNLIIQSKKDSMDQKSIQSSTTPVSGYQMGK